MSESILEKSILEEKKKEATKKRSKYVKIGIAMLVLTVGTVLVYGAYHWYKKRRRMNPNTPYDTFVKICIPCGGVTSSSCSEKTGKCTKCPNPTTPIVTEAGECVACKTDAECAKEYPNDNTRRFCIGGKCVGCDENRPCIPDFPKGAHNPNNKFCWKNECVREAPAEEYFMPASAEFLVTDDCPINQTNWWSAVKGKSGRCLPPNDAYKKLQCEMLGSLWMGAHCEFKEYNVSACFEQNPGYRVDIAGYKDWATAYKAIIDCKNELSTCSSHNKCSGHGTCENGKCKCNPGWYNEYCSQAAKECPNHCSGHGVCNPFDGDCNCELGWTGPDCSIPVTGKIWDPIAKKPACPDQFSSEYPYYNKVKTSDGRCVDPTEEQKQEMCDLLMPGLKAKPNGCLGAVITEGSCIVPAPTVKNWQNWMKNKNYCQPS